MNPRSDLGASRDAPLHRMLLAGVGYAAVVLAFVAAFVPGLGATVVAAVGGLVGNPVLVVLVGLVGGAYGLFQLYRTGRTSASPDPIVTRHPERAYYGTERTTGSDIDDSVAAVDGELPESSSKNWWTYREKVDVKNELASVATNVLANEHDVSRGGAERMLEDGSWTTDERAAAFLGDADAGSLPLRVQFLDWLSGDAYERRVEATVDAIARHADVARTDGDADDRERPSTVDLSEGADPVEDEQAPAERGTDIDGTGSRATDEDVGDVASSDIEPVGGDDGTRVEATTDSSTGPAGLELETAGRQRATTGTDVGDAVDGGDDA